LAHQEPHHKPQLSTSDTNTQPDQQNPTPPLAAYIHQIVDTAPRPTPAQLERLAGLLRDDPDSRSAH
jgi:hypothetical protein